MQTVQPIRVRQPYLGRGVGTDGIDAAPGGRTLLVQQAGADAQYTQQTLRPPWLPGPRRLGDTDDRPLGIRQPAFDPDRAARQAGTVVQPYVPSPRRLGDTDDRPQPIRLVQAEPRGEQQAGTVLQPQLPAPRRLGDTDSRSWGQPQPLRVADAPSAVSPPWLPRWVKDEPAPPATDRTWGVLRPLRGDDPTPAPTQPWLGVGRKDVPPPAIERALGLLRPVSVEDRQARQASTVRQPWTGRRAVVVNFLVIQPALALIGSSGVNSAALEGATGISTAAQGGATGVNTAAQGGATGVNTARVVS